MSGTRWECFFCNRLSPPAIQPDERQFRRASPQQLLKHTSMKSTLVLLVIGLGLVNASARDFGRKSSVTTGRGTATRSVGGTVVPGSVTRGATTTGAKGKSITTNQQVVLNADGSGRTSSGSVTGPQGQTTTTSGSVTRADGVRTAVRSITTPSGETKSATNTTTKTAPVK